jgi:glycosyltransferase involved in cell wall biosynthesis
LRVKDTAVVSLFVPSFNRGGVERMIINLARGMAELGVSVDLVVGHAPQAAHLDTLLDGVRVVRLRARGDRALAKAFAGYLSTRQPEAILSAKSSSDVLATRALRYTDATPRLYIRAVVNVNAQVARRGVHKRWWLRRTLKKVYRSASGIIAVSTGVADDVRAIERGAFVPVTVVPNPAFTPEMLDLAELPVEHPWFLKEQVPVVVGGGRLGRQKNFALLIRAFAEVLRSTEARLVIMGEGRQRDRLLKLAADLGVAHAVDLPGYVDNPYALLRRAKLFVLSSRWEGSPNILTEALLLGASVVSTDCPSGPRELLDDGRLGALVPVDDINALADAMRAGLSSRAPSREDVTRLRQRHDYLASASRYLLAMGISSDLVGSPAAHSEPVSQPAKKRQEEHAPVSNEEMRS